MLDRSCLTAAALATSALIFAFDANAQNLSIECDPNKIPEEGAPVTLYQHICQLAIDGVIAAYGDIKNREEVDIKHLEQLNVRQSTTAVINPNDPNTVTILQSGSIISYTIHETSERCNPPPVFYKDYVGNYERRWCDTSTSAQKQATVDVYYRFPTHVQFTGSYIYHCGHSEEGSMPSKVRQTVC